MKFLADENFPFPALSELRKRGYDLYLSGCFGRLAANLNQEPVMTIDLPREIEAQLKDMARAQGVSPGQYIESLVAETNLRDKQVSEFRAAIAERVASLNSGDAVDGEEVMSRLTADLASR